MNELEHNTEWAKTTGKMAHLVKTVGGDVNSHIKDSYPWNHQCEMTYPEYELIAQAAYDQAKLNKIEKSILDSPHCTNEMTRAHTITDRQRANEPDDDQYSVWSDDPGLW